jgi:hypothetical protein
MLHWLCQSRPISGCYGQCSTFSRVRRLHGAQRGDVDGEPLVIDRGLLVAALWSSLVVAVMLVIAGTGRDRYASLVVDGGACGPQRGLADPVVVTAQQQVNRVRTAGGRR